MEQHEGDILPALRFDSMAGRRFDVVAGFGGLPDETSAIGQTEAKLCCLRGDSS